MPELPEVETVRRQLLSAFQGDRIESVQAGNDSLFQNCTAEAFSRRLSGKSLKEISRVGKYLIFDCEDIYPVFHLGMSGIFLQDAGKSHYPQHIHLQFRMASGKALYYQDVRRFGKIWLHHQPPEFKHLGIDPVSGELRLGELRRLLSSRSANIKLFLMDQQSLTDIANIYASEILFEALISPFRKTDTLSGREVLALYSSIKNILYQAIDKFGTTYSAYQTVEGESGQNQNFLRVYQRHGQPCWWCAEPIRKVVLGNRSTFYCPNCQK